MVAFVIAAAVVTFEPCQRVGKDGQSGGGKTIVDAGEPVALERGEALAEVELRCRQHVDDVVRAVAEHRQAVGAGCHAPQHQRRIERYRVERTRGDADEWCAVGVRVAGRARRDHGHAGGELRQRPLEMLAIEIGGGGLARHDWGLGLGYAHVSGFTQIHDLHIGMAAMHSTRINLIRVCDVFGGFSHKAGEPTLPAIVAESSQSPLK